MPKTLSMLLPSVEHRLQTWGEIQHRLAAAAERKIRPTITLARKFGCEGFPVAERLQQLLAEASGEPWNVFDRALVEKVAQEENLSPKLLEDLGDMSRALEALGLYATTHVTHDRAFEKVARYVVQIARVGNAVVVGRGGAILCAGLANCFHFRLEAGVGWRVKNMMERLDLSQREAEHLVETSSKQRERFISQALGADITELRHYDAVFNNERHGPDEIARAIVAYVRSAWTDGSYFR